jgi:hypothetical protein
MDSQRRPYDHEQVLASLRHAWQLTQESASGLSYSRYQELLNGGQISGASAVRIVQMFGAWSTATEQADVPSGRVPDRSYSSHWSDADVLAYVLRYLKDPESSGSFAGWDGWRRTNEPKAPSGALMRARFGKWSTIKALAADADAGR